MSKPFALDLLAVFSIIEEDIVKMLDQAKKENWDAHTLIQKIEEKI